MAVLHLVRIASELDLYLAWYKLGTKGFDHSKKVEVQLLFIRVAE